MSEPIQVLWDRLRDAPTDASAFIELAAQLVETQDWPGLTRLYETRASAVEPLEASLLHLTIAEKVARELDDKELAEASYERALRNADRVEGLLELLSDVFWKKGYWHLLETILEEEVRMTPPGDEKGAAYLELARFRIIKLDQPKRAAETYLKAYHESANLAPVCLEELERLNQSYSANDAVGLALQEIYRDTQRFGELHELLSNRLRNLGSDMVMARFSLLMTLTRVAGRDLSRWDLAVNYLEQAGEVQPERLEEVVETAVGLRKIAPNESVLMTFLQQIWERTDQWENALEMIQARIQTAGPSVETASLACRAGDILWHNLDRRLEALESFEAAVNLDPTCREEIVERYQQYAAEVEDVEVQQRLEELLQAHLRQMGRHQEMLQLWQARLDRAQQTPDRVDLLVQIGDLIRKEQSDPHGAFESYREAAAIAERTEHLASLMERLFELELASIRLDEVEPLIETLAEKHQRWDDLFYLLTIRLERAQGASEQAAIQYRMAEILETRLGDSGTAVTYYLQAAELDPTNSQYLRTAREALLRVGRPQESLRLFDRDIDQAADPEMRSALLCRKAQVLWTDLNRPMQSLGVLFSSLLESPEDQAVRAALADLLATERGPLVLDQLLVEMTEHPTEQLDLPRLATAMAYLLTPEGRTELDDRSLELLLVLDRHVALGEDLQFSLVSGLAARMRYLDQYAVLERRSERLAEPAKKREIFEDLLVLCQDFLRDEELTIQTYTKLVETFPDDGEALSELIRILESTRRFAELDHLYRLVIGRFPADQAQPELIRLLERFALFQLDRLNRPDLASDTYRRTLDLDPLNTAAVEFFRQYFSKPEDVPSYFELLAGTLTRLEEPVARSQRLAELGEVAASRLGFTAQAVEYFQQILLLSQASEEAVDRAFRGLEEIYRKSGQNEQLLAVLGEKATHTQDPGLKIACLMQVMELQEELDRLEDMVATIDEILAVKPDDLPLLERAADVALQLDDAEREIKYTRMMIDLAPDQTEVRLRAARILSDQLGDHQQALEEVTVILNREPGNRILLDFAEEILSNLGRFTEWRDLLVSQVDQAPSEEIRVDLLLRLADAADTAGPEPEMERDWRAWALSEVLRLRPDRMDVAETLVKHLEDMGQWSQAAELAESLLRQATQVDQRLPLLMRLGSLFEHQLDQMDRAKLLYHEAVELQPEDSGSHRALLRIAEKTEDFKAITEHTRKIIEFEPLADDLSELVSRAAQVAEQMLDDKATAVELYTSLVALDPLARSSLEQLARLLETTGDYSALAETWDRLAALAETDQQRADLWLKKAMVVEEKLDQQERAAEAYQDILRLQPANRLALNALKRIYSATGRWQDVLSLLERLAQLDPDPHIRGALWREAAQVYEEQLEQPEKAFELHRMTYELLDDETTSIKHLRRLAQQHDLWEPYIRVLLKDMQQGRSSAEQIDHLIDAATIMADQLGRAERAYDLLMTQFEPAPREDELFSALTHMGIRHQLWERLEEAYRRLVRATLEPENKVRLYHQLADTLAQQGQVPTRALAVLQEAYLTHPTNRETLARMELLATEHDLWEALESFYQERWDEAVEVREKTELLRLRADILEHRLDRWKDGFDQLVVAFQLAPDNPELEVELVRIAREYQQWETLLKLFDLIVQERSERTLRLHLLVEMARIAGEELDSPSRAFDFIGRAWQLDTKDEGLRQKLEQYAFASQRLTHLADAYEWEATSQADPPERLQAWFRLARLCTVQLSDVGRAVRAYTEAFRVDPDNAEVLQSLEEILIAHQQEERLLATLTEWAQFTGKPEQSVLLFHHIARLAERLGLKEGAVEAYRGVLTFEPNDLDALEGLARLHREAGAWDRVARCLTQAVGLTRDRQRQYEMLRELAEIYTGMERYEQALQELERALRLLPNLEPPIEQLVDLYLKVDKAEAAINLLESKSHQAPPEEAGALLLQATLIATDLLKDGKRASRLCNRAVRKDPQNMAAWTLLVDLCEESGRWRDQVEAYRSLADLALSQDESTFTADKKRLLAKLAKGLPEIDADHLDRIPPPHIASLYLALAAIALEKGLLYTEQALRTWQRAIEIDPEWPVGHIEIARLTQSIGRWEEAEAASRTAVSLLRQWTAGPLLSQAWTRLAISLERTALQPAEAITTYESALAADPSNRFAQDRYTSLLAATNQLPRAVHFLAGLLKSDLDSQARRAALVAYAHALKSQGQTGKSAEALLQAIQLGEEAIDVSWELGDLLLSNAQYEHAVDVYSQLLAQVESDRDAGHQDPAFSAKRREWNKKLAQAAEMAGNIDLAQQSYTEAHGLDPSDPEVLVGLARLALQRGAAALANHYVDEVLSSNLGDPAVQDQAMLVKADSLMARGNTPGAIVILEQVHAAAGPGQKDAITRLAAVYTERSQWDKAHIAIQDILELTEPGIESAAWLVQLADIAQEHLNSPEEAWDALVRATAEDPGNLQAKEKALALSVKLGRWKIGTELADSLLPRLPEPDQVVRCRVLAASAALGHGEYKVAQTHYSAALRLDPHNRELLEALVETARKSEDYHDLAQQLELHLDRLGPARSVTRELVINALIEVYSGPLPDWPRALQLGDELIGQHPDDLEAWRKRLDIVLQTAPPDGTEVARTIHRLASLGQLDLGHVRALQTWYGQHHQYDRAFVLTSLLEMCQATTESEKALLRRALSTSRRVREVDALTGEIFEKFVRFQPPPTAVLIHLTQAAAAAVSDDYLRIETGLHDDEPLDAEFKMSASVLGLNSARLRLGEPGSPTRFFNAPIPQVHLDPAWLEGLSESQLRFELGYLACLCLPEYIMCSLLSELEYVGFHEAALEPLIGVDEAFGRDERMEAAVRGWRIVFGRDPDLQPQPEPGRSGGMARADAPNPAQWSEHARHTAVRVGLLLCDDPAAALMQLMRRHPALADQRIRSGQDLTHAMSLHPAVRHLVAYLLSDDYYQVREGLDLARVDFDLTTVLPEAATGSLEDKAVAQFELEIEKGSVD